MCHFIFFQLCSPAVAQSKTRFPPTSSALETRLGSTFPSPSLQSFGHWGYFETFCFSDGSQNSLSRPKDNSIKHTQVWPMHFLLLFPVSVLALLCWLEPSTYSLENSVDYSCLTQGKPIHRIVFAQGPGCAQWVMQRDGNTQCMSQKHLILGKSSL